MKRTIQIIIFLGVFLTAPSLVKSQAFDAQKAYTDYQYHLSIYQQDYSDYQDAKAFYQNNPTLQLKEAARQKVLKMLRDRDRLLVVYLTAIRMQIYESTGFNDTQKGAIFQKIDTEIAWYKTHIDNYLTGDSLDTLFVKSDESKVQFRNKTILTIYESVFDVGLSQEIGLRVSHQKIYSDLTNYINEQVALNKLKIDPFNRWLNDTDAVLITLQVNETAANNKIQTLYSQNYGINQSYGIAIQYLEKSISSLAQLNSYLTEMLVSIQNQSQ